METTLLLVWNFLEILKVELLYNIAIPFLGIYLKEVKLVN